MCNFLQEVKSDKNLFHSLNPQNIEQNISDRISLSVSGFRLKQFLHIRIRLKAYYPSGYPTGKPYSDHLW